MQQRPSVLSPASRPPSSSLRPCLAPLLAMSALAIALGACAKEPSHKAPPRVIKPPTAQPASDPAASSDALLGPELLTAFGSQASFQQYLDELEEMYRKQMKQRRSRRAAGVSSKASSSAESSAAQPAAPPAESADKSEADGDDDSEDNESITNNQESGVDEGGIIKTHGDHLVILRRGRLFTVRIGDQSMTPVSMIDVFPPGASQAGGAWYDEMLIHEGTIVVVGYSYRAQGTEIGLFDVDDQGGLSHRDTHYLRSNDYYSSRNYASRLLGSKLVFYMPYNMVQTRWNDGELSLEATLPGVRHYQDKGTKWQDIITSRTIYRPVQHTPWPVLHTVVTCDLAASEPGSSLSCSARSVIGPHGRNFYVSRNAVYIWVSGIFVRDAGPSTIARQNPGSTTNAVVYRMPLDGGEPGAIRTWGAPTDQFSFKESADGDLNVLVRANGGGDAMWRPEVTSGDVALLKAPMRMFSTRVPVADRARYTALPRPEKGWAFQNRFVGDHVLYGTGSSWGWYDKEHDPRVFVQSYVDPGAATRVLSLPHGVDRIEALGRDAVVVGSDGKNLHFSAVALGSVPALADRYTQAGASQGETRSHGFFYRPTSRSRGVLGLPIRSGSRPGYAQLASGSASILYLEVKDLTFQPIGQLASRDTTTNDRCKASCVDWYGNARPIFWRGRVFALLGYELVEGRIAGGRIAEVGRTNYYKEQPRR